MDEIRICGLPEQLVLDINSRRNPVASWFVEGSLPRIDREQIEACVQAAFNTWSTVANCKGRKAASRATADLIVSVTRLDGPLGVLADCELPGPPVQHLRCDISEQWIVHIGLGVPQGYVDLQRVLVHEIGHYFGIGHIGRGNLMAPTYSTQLYLPQQGDIEEMQGRYGPPVVPDPGHPDEPDQLIIIGKSGKPTARFKLERMDL